MSNSPFPSLYVDHSHEPLRIGVSWENLNMQKTSSVSVVWHGWKAQQRSDGIAVDVLCLWRKGGKGAGHSNGLKGDKRPATTVSHAQAFVTY